MRPMFSCCFLCMACSLCFPCGFLPTYQTLYSGRLGSPMGVSVSRKANIANLNNDLLGSGPNLQLSFDKLWYYYYNRVPFTVCVFSKTEYHCCLYFLLHTLTLQKCALCSHHGFRLMCIGCRCGAT